MEEKKYILLQSVVFLFVRPHPMIIDLPSYPERFFLFNLPNYLKFLVSLTSLILFFQQNCPKYPHNFDYFKTKYTTTISYSIIINIPIFDYYSY